MSAADTPVTAYLWFPRAIEAQRVVDRIEIGPATLNDGWTYRVASRRLSYGVRYFIEVRDETGALIGAL